MPRNEHLIREAAGLMSVLIESTHGYRFLPEWIDARSGAVSGKEAIDDLGDTLPFALWTAKLMDNSKEASRIAAWTKKKADVALSFQEQGFFRGTTKAGLYSLDAHSDLALGLGIMGAVMEDGRFDDSLISFFRAMEKYAMYPDGYIAYYAKRGIKLPFSSGKWCGLYAEEAARLANRIPKANLTSLATKILQPWLGGKFALKTGLFPFVTPIPIARLVVDPLMRFKIGIPRSTVMTSKSNTNLIYGICETLKLTGDKMYKDALARWVDGMEQHLRSDKGPWHVVWYPKSDKKRYICLGTDHAVIDSLLEISKTSLDGRAKKLAIDTADAWLSVQQKTGLVPQGWKGEPVSFAPDIRQKEWNISRLDNQTDFAMVLMKMHEMTGKKEYLDRALGIIDSVIRYHKTEKGYVDYVDARTGKKLSSKVETKYEFLLLKAFLQGYLLSNSKKDTWAETMIRDR